MAGSRVSRVLSRKDISPLRHCATASGSCPGAELAALGRSLGGLQLDDVRLHEREREAGVDDENLRAVLELGVDQTFAFVVFTSTGQVFARSAIGEENQLRSIRGRPSGKLGNGEASWQLCRTTLPTSELRRTLPEPLIRKAQRESRTRQDRRVHNRSLNQVDAAFHRLSPHRCVARLEDVPTLGFTTAHAEVRTFAFVAKQPNPFLFAAKLWLASVSSETKN